MNKYEIMFIVKSENDEKTIKDTVSAFEKVLTDMKAKIVKKNQQNSQNKSQNNCR